MTSRQRRLTSSIPAMLFTASFFSEPWSFLSSAVAVLWTTFFFLRAVPWGENRCECQKRIRGLNVKHSLIPLCQVFLINVGHCWFPFLIISWCGEAVIATCDVNEAAFLVSHIASDKQLFWLKLRHHSNHQWCKWFICLISFMIIVHKMKALQWKTASSSCTWFTTALNTIHKKGKWWLWKSVLLEYHVV